MRFVATRACRSMLQCKRRRLHGKIRAIPLIHLHKSKFVPKAANSNRLAVWQIRARLAALLRTCRSATTSASHIWEATINHKRPASATAPGKVTVLEMQLCRSRRCSMGPRAHEQHPPAAFSSRVLLTRSEFNAGVPEWPEVPPSPASGITAPAMPVTRNGPASHSDASVASPSRNIGSATLATKPQQHALAATSPSSWELQAAVGTALLGRRLHVECALSCPRMPRLAAENKPDWTFSGICALHRLQLRPMRDGAILAAR